MARPIDIDKFCWFLLTNYDLFIKKNINLTTPFQDNRFLLHPQLDLIIKFCYNFNALLRPNLQGWTWFDLLIISGVKFWGFSFYLLPQLDFLKLS